MQYRLMIVEQLDRAVSELTTDHPINNRLALILIDNATELILHRQCTGRLETDAMFAPIHYATQALLQDRDAGSEDLLSEDLDGSILTPRQRAILKRRYFDKRLKVLEELEDLSQDERRFIRVAHGYRNELYHVGLARDDILRAVAGHYFVLCCNLFARMDAGVFSMVTSSEDRYTQVAIKYLGTRNGRIDFSNSDKGILASKLCDALPDTIPDLSVTLSDAADDAISEILECFAFLVRENPLSLDAKSMLRIAQWQFDLAAAVERNALMGLWIDPNYRNELDRIVAELQSEWTQRFTSTPFKAWQQRASSLASESDPLVVLHSYESLRKDMSYLEGAIRSASDELDQWIQMEIDKRRGK